MEATDLAAVERTRAGDTAAFRVLVERYGRSVFRLAFRMTANEFDAEDVVELQRVVVPDCSQLFAGPDPVTEASRVPTSTGK